MTRAETDRNVERSASLDPTTLSVVWGALESVLDEVGGKVLYATQSFVMANVRDLGTAVLDAEGRIVAVAAYLPIHMLVAGEVLPHVKEWFGNKFYPGDFIIGNDPYIIRSSHLPDWSFIRPIFYKDELLGFFQFKGHVADTGGFLPGGYGPGAYDIIAEGLNIPPLRIIEKGVLNKELWGFLLRNVRNPTQVDMDTMLINGALAQAEENVVRLAEKYGADTVKACMQEMIDAGERATRTEITKIPDGVYYGESAADWDGATDKPIWVRVDVTVKGDEIAFDFSKSDPQATFVNSPVGNTVAHTLIAFYLVLDPSVPRNQGNKMPVSIAAPEGCVCNPRYPATVGACAISVGNQIIEACLMALSKAIPEKVPAGFAKHWCPINIGMDRRVTDPRTGTIKQYFAETFASDGSAGASKGYDGWQGIGCYCWVGGIVRPDMEIFESTVPYRVLKYEVLQDWEGAGEFRGGPGVYVELVADTVPGDPAILMTGNSDGAVMPPFGVAGGQVPPTVQAWIESPDGKKRPLRTMANEPMFPGEICYSKVSGGGGWGYPFNRDVKRVQRDVIEGLVSVNRARDTYGVVLDAKTFEVDHQVTEKLRSEMKAGKRQL
jgi:N-methylhydantoinase B